MTHRDESYRKALEDRETVKYNLNQYFIRENSDFRIKFLHDLFDLERSGHEVAEKNTTINRTSPRNVENALGFDLVLTKGNHQDGLRILIRFSNDFNLFIKVPSEYIDNPHHYLEIIKNDYIVLYVHRKYEEVYDQYARPILLKDLVSAYFNNYWRQGSGSNSNRYSFQHPKMQPAKLTYRSPTAEQSNSLQKEPTLLEHLTNIWERKHEN